MARSMTELNIQNFGYPESCVGYIEVVHEGSVIVTGSAFLIHRSLAVTCAHNCLRTDNRVEYDSIRFCVKREGVVMGVSVRRVYYL